MTFTNEERREVAGRIRERIWRNCRAAWDVVLESSCVDVFGYRFRSNEEFALFLADLIDHPTCRKLIPDEMEGLVFCSNCGVEIGEYSAPNYCHNCGAEVIK